MKADSMRIVHIRAKRDRPKPLGPGFGSTTFCGLKISKLRISEFGHDTEDAGNLAYAIKVRTGQNSRLCKSCMMIQKDSHYKKWKGRVWDKDKNQWVKNEIK